MALDAGLAMTQVVTDKPEKRKTKSHMKIWRRVALLQLYKRGFGVSGRVRINLPQGDWQKLFGDEIG